MKSDVPKFKLTSSKGVDTNCRTLHDPLIECARYFLRRSTERGLRKLNPASSEGRNGISLCRTKTYTHLEKDRRSYLYNHDCPTSAAAYLDPKSYEKEIWKCKNIFSKYNSNDRIILTPPMIIGQKKILSSLLLSSGNISSGTASNSTNNYVQNTNTEDFTECARSNIFESHSSTTRPKCREKVRYCSKSRREDCCQKKESSLEKRKRDISFLDADVNYLTKEIMDEMNNNVVKVDKTGSTDEMKKIIPIPIQSSALNIPDPSGICAEHFYNWMDKLPIRESKKNCEYRANNNWDAEVYHCCIPCQCQVQCQRNIPECKGSEIQPQEIKQERKNEDLSLSRTNVKDCPDFHDMKIPTFDPEKFLALARAREAMLFCQGRRFAHSENRDPIFYKLQTTEVRPPSAERDYIWENNVKALRMVPAKPEKFIVDDRKGTRHNFIRSGLAPIYITGNQYGKVPEYLEERRKEQGLPPCDLSIYRVRKRCPKCGHDHTVCQHKKITEEKLRKSLKQAMKNRFHSPGVIPSQYQDICCMTTTWGCQQN